MNEKENKRLRRSLTFFVDKKNGKYKRRKLSDNSSTVVVDNAALDSRYGTNVILTDVTLILADRFGNAFPSAQQFLNELKRLFTNSKTILFTGKKSEIDLAKRTFSAIDVYIETKDVLGERPLLYFRNFLAQKFGAPALIGPNVLLTDRMNPFNNKQYDVVKDVRRFYNFDKNVLVGVDYGNLLEDIKNSVEYFTNNK